MRRGSKPQPPDVPRVVHHQSRYALLQDVQDTEADGRSPTRSIWGSMSVMVFRHEGWPNIFTKISILSLVELPTSSPRWICSRTGVFSLPGQIYWCTAAKATPRVILTAPLVRWENFKRVGLDFVVPQIRALQNLQVSVSLAI